MNWQLEFWSNQWLDVLGRASVHGGIAIVMMSVAALVMGRLNISAWVEHWLWRLVFLKFLLALIITQPIAIAVLAPPDPAMVADSMTILPNAVPAVEVVAVNDAVALTDQNIRVVAEANPPRNGSIHWPLVLLAVWLIGVAGNLLVLGRQLLATWRLNLEPVTNEELTAIYREIARSQQVERLPLLAVSEQLSSPALVGWLRPAIVLPTETLQRCTIGQLRAVLGHELSHYRRADLWWNLLPAAAQVVFYFHPLLWLANWRWRLSGEMACDATAIESSASSVSEYADSLLQIAMFGSRSMQSKRCLGCVSVIDSSRSLKQRLFAMKDYRPDSAPRVLVYGVCIAIIGLLCTVPWQLVSRAADERDDTKFGSNMSFEEQAEASDRAKDWGGGGKGYTLTLEQQNPHLGKRCAKITSDGGPGFGTYTQCIDAGPLRGKRVQFSGFLRSNLEGNGGLWMRVDQDGSSVAFDNMDERRIQGKTKWAEHKVVLDVPAAATKICFGFLMVGKGDLWADDLKIAVLGQVGQGAATTGMQRERFQLPAEAANLDFEQESPRGGPLVKSWGGGGNGYELARDTIVKHSGSASGRIKRVEDGNFGTLTQFVDAEQYRGKRVRYTGFLKSEDADRGGLWMRVDGDHGKVLSFDNMNARPVSGTTDWKQYEVVLDVPQESVVVTFGFLLSGDGTLWGDDLKLETVGNVGEGPASTEMKQVESPTDFVNGDFEKARGKSPVGWGGGGIGYELIRDTDVKHGGQASGRIVKTGDQKHSFGTFTQMFPADKYKGKRVRLSGFLKTNEAKQAGLWMRIDGPDTSPLGFDNMTNRAVNGTTDWTEYSVVLDVPDNATFIALGFLLIGEGTAWGDDLKLESVGEVGEGPASTNSL